MMAAMPVRQRPADTGADTARRIGRSAGTELRDARRALSLAQRVVARAAGMSASQLGRLERGETREPTVAQLCRVAAALGLAASVKFYPEGSPVRDAGQLALFGRFEKLLAVPLRMPREVSLPIHGDTRAWDAMIVGSGEAGFAEGEVRLGDLQALSRRIDLKLRDDPRGTIVILVVARTRHNQRVLGEHREALRAQFPLDGAAIARALRAGRLPPASGIIVV